MKQIITNVENFEKGVAFFKEGKFRQALEQVNLSISKDAENLEFYFFRARVNSRLGEFNSSLEDFDFLISQEPYNPTYINDRAVVLHLLKRNDEAMSEFDRAVNLEPGNPYRFASRAYFKDRIGDLLGSIRDYEKAIELDPEDAVSYNNKGLVEEKLGYIQKSKTSFKKSDDLIGYEPEYHDQNINQGSEFPKAKTNDSNNLNQGINSDNQMNISKYFGMISKLISDKGTRIEFWKFLRSKF
ncbi:tetratricopeptide repeat protein [Aquiflexum lacus]|uniref:tetratricopeptide repeat protein n=1 Tax=Aquiflexum lacus TaxID=2483805 RepID=UPI001E3F866B|nr:tetratricopeptide repeat protein [Aquiflexum lacus]